MDSRRLNRKVLIQYPATGQDDIGQPTPGGWANLVTAGDGKVWADIKHLNGLEAIKGGAETAVRKASIRIRYRTDVTTAMQVVHGTTVYQVKAVLPAEDVRDRLDLQCEVVA